MKTRANNFLFKVVVRRVAAGSTPFAWEVHRDDTIVPLHVSADRFGTMEAAYIAGRAKMEDFAAR